MLYAYVDASGRIESAYNDSTVEALPAGAYPLTDAQFEDRFNLRLDGAEFISDPQPPVEPTAEEILRSNTAARDGLLYTAAALIAPLQDAVDLDIATDNEKTSLTAWKKYRVDVNRVDLTANEPTWPPAPQ